MHLRKKRTAAIVVSLLFAVSTVVVIAIFFQGFWATAEESTKAEVRIIINAEGADNAAVKAKAEILDADSKSVVDEREFDANESVSVGELPEGTYSLNVVSAPVLEDGSTYKLPDEAVGFEIEGDDPVEVEVTLEPISAEDMTKEQLEAVAQELDDAGQSQAASAARTKSETASSVAGSVGSVSRPSSSTSSGSSSNTGNSGSGSAGGTTSGGSTGGSSSSGGGTQTHTHNWVAQTEQQWVSNNVWVVDQAAWDEYLPGSEYILCSCGQTFGSNEEWTDHNKSLGWGVSHSYSVQTSPGQTIHHDEVGHWEDQGHYETVTTGYVCSGCGTAK